MKKEKKIIKLIEEKGIIRVKEVESLNISRQYLYRLVRRGILEKVNRGMYKIKNRKFPDDEMLLILTKKINNFTICLLSALQYYNMTTQNPSQIWVAVKNNYRIPKINIPIKIRYLAIFLNFYSIMVLSKVKDNFLRLCLWSDL